MHWMRAFYSDSQIKGLTYFRYTMKVKITHIKITLRWFGHLFSYLTECQGAHTASRAHPTATPAADAAFLQCSDTRNQTISNPTSRASYQLLLTVCPFSPPVPSPLSVSNDPGFSSLAFLPLFSGKKVCISAIR